MPQALVFDLDGTLLQYTTAYRTIVEKTFIAVTRTVRDGWVETYQEAFFEVFEACQREPVRRGFAAVGHSGTSDALARELLKQEIRATETPVKAHLALDHLSDSYHLAVLTNGFPTWQRRKFGAHDLEPYFETIVASYEVGAHKPNPKPFRAVERRIDADVDGRLESDGVPLAIRETTSSKYPENSGGSEGDSTPTVVWKSGTPHIVVTFLRTNTEME